MIRILNLSQIVTVKWNNYTKKYYQSLGYKFTKCGESFDIPLKDLKKSSDIFVTAVCDCCGQEYYPTYKNYNRCHQKKQKDYCRKCAKFSAKDTMLKRYGVEHYQQTEECKSRKEKTCLEKYGVANPSQIKEVQEKKVKTNQQKFGTKWFVQSSAFKQMCELKYKTDNPMKSKIIQEKAIQSFVENGTMPVSKEENKLIELIKSWYGSDKCTPSFPVGRFVLDCLLTIEGNRIDIEYDGVYWHKSREQYDKQRNAIMIKYGYKIIRILSNGKMPNFEQFNDGIQKLLAGDKIVKIDLT